MPVAEKDHIRSGFKTWELSRGFETDRREHSCGAEFRCGLKLAGLAGSTQTCR